MAIENTSTIAGTGQEHQLGYAAIGIQAIEKNLNWGGVLRAAQCYDVKLVVIGGKFIREVTDTGKAYQHIPIIQRQDDIFDAIPFDCIPVAVEMLDGAESIVDFEHPEQAFYIFGAESSTLGRRITARCKHTIFVPTRQCMNLSATVNVVLYDRLAKQHRREQQNPSTDQALLKTPASPINGTL